MGWNDGIVDTTEGGWATDATASLVAALFFASSLLTSMPTHRHHHVGTAVVFLCGMIVHRDYPRRAVSGAGQWQFYALSALGYAGSAYRATLGYDLAPDVLVSAFQQATALAVASVAAAACATVAAMHLARSAVNGAAMRKAVACDMWFGASEGALVLCEIAGAALFLAEQVARARAAADGGEWWRDTAHLPCGVAVFGLVAFQYGLVYGAGATLALRGYAYDSGLFQRVFHYTAVCVSWALHTHALLLHLRDVCDAREARSCSAEPAAGRHSLIGCS
ncbi:hypothetical protein KFE25_012853 [Diacronema lutheri]|uniref:Uncharacterized protein n=1 Tax=Diacronema lutheri TaxID=2081491 RepID=A0A8J6C9K4_DIALT|nr:hypothetical protein KFE25_012853 [Diacronema lutheri]